MLKAASVCLLFIPFCSVANELCFQNAIKKDVCAYASGIASEVAKVLPIQLSDNMSIVSVDAISNKVVIVAQLDYNYDYLSSVYNGDIAFENKIKETMRIYSKSNICTDKQTSQFVSLGGEVEYKFVFNDGNIFDSYAITGCP